MRPWSQLELAMSSVLKTIWRVIKCQSGLSVCDYGNSWMPCNTLMQHVRNGLLFDWMDKTAVIQSSWQMWCVYNLIDGLIDWWIDWLIDWLILIWLTDWLIDWLMLRPWRGNSTWYRFMPWYFLVVCLQCM